MSFEIESLRKLFSTKQPSLESTAVTGSSAAMLIVSIFEAMDREIKTLKQQVKNLEHRG